MQTIEPKPMTTEDYIFVNEHRGMFPEFYGRTPHDEQTQVCFFFGERTNRIKIGHSALPQQRFHALGMADSDDLKLIAVVPGIDKKQIHRRFRSSRVPGKNEWFAKGARLTQYIQSFRQTGEKMYKILAKQAHPDHGGSHERMVELNDAIEKIRQRLPVFE